MTNVKPIESNTKPTAGKPWKVPAGAVQIGEPIQQPAVNKPKPVTKPWKVPAGATVGHTVDEPAHR